jgi:hypothetical protein
MRHRKAILLYHPHHNSCKPVAGSPDKSVSLVFRYNGNNATEVESEEVVASACCSEADILQKLGSSFADKCVEIGIIQR